MENIKPPGHLRDAGVERGGSGSKGILRHFSQKLSNVVKASPF